MQQNASAVPFGVAKHDSWAGPQLPGAQPYPQSAYGAQQQQWQGHGAPSPSTSPQPGYAQPAQFDAGMYKHEGQTARPLNELEGGDSHTQPTSELPGAPIRTQ
jgi:hypothetical protein